MEYLGNEVGGRLFPVERFRAGMVIFCLGVGDDISFEEEAIKYGVKIYCFDPTPKSIALMARHPEMTFFPVGIWGESGRQRFYFPKDPTHVSCSIGNLQETEDYFEADVITYEEAVELAGVRPDLLKMNIEGSEYGIIDTITVWPEILMVSFHGEDEAKYVVSIFEHYVSCIYDNNSYLFG